MQSNNERGGPLPLQSRSRVDLAPTAQQVFRGRPMGKSTFYSMLQRALGLYGPPKPAHLSTPQHLVIAFDECGAFDILPTTTALKLKP